MSIHAVGVHGQRNVLTRFVRIDTNREVDVILVEKRLQRVAANVSYKRCACGSNGHIRNWGPLILALSRARSSCRHDIYVASRMGMRYIAPRSL